MVDLIVFKTISINSHKGRYNVFFKNNLNNIIKDFDFKNSHLIIDKKVFSFYENFFRKLPNINRSLIIQSNEKNKSLEKIPKYINWLVENKIKKSHNIVAIGGGIIQDITCFISATLLRGVEWNFIPTTLLSQADSCIGSKSSINCNNVKNILGTFTPPKNVLIYSEFLKTLQLREIKSGIGEMLKVHAISGVNDFNSIKKVYKDLFTKQDIMLDKIYKSLIIKKKFIEIDEFDKGLRNIFNYGHSFGHAIERATNFKIPHGIAVSMGCDLANFTSMKLGICSEKYYLNMSSTLQENYKSFRKINIDRSLFYDALSKDKKNVNNDSFSLVLPNGESKIFIDKYKNNKKIRSIIDKFFNNL